MTYFAFLAYFLVIPIIILVIFAYYDRRRGVDIPPSLRSWPSWAAIILHVVIALLYTTLWL